MNFEGLGSDEVRRSRERVGSNALTRMSAEPISGKIAKGLKNPTILILVVAFFLQLVLFFSGYSEWYECFGIFVAICISDFVSAFGEYNQEKKAIALRYEAQSKERSKVVRSGSMCETRFSDIVVGDIVYLQPGDKVPADGIVIDGSVLVDQSALNGCDERAEKVASDSPETNLGDLLSSSSVFRGSVVISGAAYVRVHCVGDRTVFGNLSLKARDNAAKTPLQLKLSALARDISFFGCAGALLAVFSVMAKFAFMHDLPSSVFGWIDMTVDSVMVAVSVIVCAVPEGLPMLTSILFSAQSSRMMRDNVLVRKIKGLETIGRANLLLVDKMGILTDGHPAVAEFILGNVNHYSDFSALSPEFEHEFLAAAAVNNGAKFSLNGSVGGNATDRALLDYVYLKKVAFVPDSYDVVSMVQFSPDRRFSSVVLRENDADCVYNKGAMEFFMDKCDFYLNENGESVKFSDKSALMGYLDSRASAGLSMLALTRNVSGEDGSMTLIAVIGICDDMREGIAESVDECRAAGIQVVMVTGDGKETAVSGARDSGILVSDSDLVLTSAELSGMNDDDVRATLPRLRVLAQALPQDKARLAEIAQSMKYVVGVTGGGVNDASALKKADVGLAMGSGTEVAKEAADIVMLDDSFFSIEKAILYGRTIFKDIRKFLTFQLTVNVAVVLVTFLGPLFGHGFVFTALQLLLVNLVMDAFAAFAFGAEKPLGEYMREKPVPINAGIMTVSMCVEIAVQSAFICFASLSIISLPAMKALMGCGDMTYLKTSAFAFFMMSVLFNGFNVRTERRNPLYKISTNRMFSLIVLFMFLILFTFIAFGGEMLSVTQLNFKTWSVCICLSMMVFPIDMVRKTLVKLKNG